MIKNPSINHRQLAWLTSSIVTSVGILSMHSVHSRIAGIDAWFSYFLPLVYVFGVASFFAFLIKLFPGKNLFEAMNIVFGKTWGTFINFIVVFHFALMVSKDIYILSIFTSTILLNHTPIEIIIVFFCILLIYYGQKNIEVLSRVNDIFYPLFILSILSMPIVLSTKLSLAQLTPTLTASMSQWLTSNLLATGAMGDVFVIGVFLHALCSHKQFQSAMRYGATVGVSLLTLVVGLEIMVFGPHMPRHMVFSVYELIQMIQITEFLDRVDLILFSIWLPTMTCKIIITYLALLLGIKQIFHCPNERTLNKPIAFLLSVVTFYGFHNSADVISFVNFSMPVISFGYQFVLIIVVYICIKLQGKSYSSRQMDELPSIASTPMKSIHNNWIQIPMISLAISICCLAIGWTWSTRIPIIASISAIAYCTSLALLVYTSYRQLKITVSANDK
jgi:spore germination protein KB